jgi:hypothetical protein
MRQRRIRPTLTQVIFASVLMAMLITPFAVAQTSSDGSRVTKNDARYAFIARNTNQGDGGSGAFACQSDVNPAGQTNREPCLNMVNKGTGFAAAFRTRGLTGFRLQTSGAGEATPFKLDPNATGKVDHLNADTVDGQSATEIGRERFARVNVDGAGAPTLVRGNGTIAQNAVTRVGAGDYRVEFSADVNSCVYQATAADPANSFIVSASEDATNTKRVVVNTRDGAGADVGTPADAPFNLTVNC